MHLESMEALLSFQEAIERSSCRHHRTLSLPPPPPLQVLSQSYKTSSRIAHHEGIPHPVGTLFTLNREYEIHLPSGAIGEDSQERTLDNGNHTVLASYGGRACERRFSVSTSHVVGSNNIKTQYNNNSRGDSFCSLYACHHFDEETLLSTSYIEGYWQVGEEPGEWTPSVACTHQGCTASKDYIEELCQHKYPVALFLPLKMFIAVSIKDMGILAWSLNGHRASLLVPHGFFWIWMEAENSLCKAVRDLEKQLELIYLHPQTSMRKNPSA